MTGWVQDELRKIAEADDLHIAPFREDGTPYGTPTWTGRLRSTAVSMCGPITAKAPDGYRSAMRQKVGRIIAAGLTKEVAFEPVEGAINDRIDEAYRAKYRDNSYLVSMIQRPRALRH